jgi:hypothetical protein
MEIPSLRLVLQAGHLKVGVIEIKIISVCPLLGKGSPIMGKFSFRIFMRIQKFPRTLPIKVKDNNHLTWRSPPKRKSPVMRDVRKQHMAGEPAIKKRGFANKDHQADQVSVGPLRMAGRGFGSY